MLQPIEQALDFASGHHAQGHLAEARTIYRQILDRHPDHADALHLLGVLEAQSHQVESAIALIRRAITLAPDQPIFYANLGMILEGQGRNDEALLCYREAARLNPADADLHYKLGNAHRTKGNMTEAQASFQEAVRLNPSHAAALNNLGNCHRLSGRLAEAAACFEAVLRVNPADHTAMVNLAGALQKLDRYADATDCYRRVVALQSDDPALREVRVAAQSCLVFARLFDPAADALAISAELAHWNYLREKPPVLPTLPADPAPDRRLRIGYVSSDFQNHVVGQNILPLFRNHDHAKFEIFCYSSGASTDFINAEFRRLTDHFHDITVQNDDQAAARIRCDRIDILVDLALHTSGNRLAIFARKPAPIQATFAGYPGSTGLSTIDYRITDPYLDPPGQDDSVYCEKSMRLGASFWCFDPLGDEPPVTELPAASRRHITFGCLNNSYKINDTILQLWTRILASLPNSRLLLLAASGIARDRTASIFTQAGIAPDRIEFHARCPRIDYLRLFNQIDLSLDTLPYNGHTTSLDSLFMGVPVLTLVGRTVVGRAGLSQLMNLGLPELIARTPEEYVQIALDLARNPARLGALRATLRERMKKSPLMDAPRFASDIESQYRQMWIAQKTT